MAERGEDLVGEAHRAHRERLDVVEIQVALEAQRFAGARVPRAQDADDLVAEDPAAVEPRRDVARARAGDDQIDRPGGELLPGKGVDWRDDAEAHPRCAPADAVEERPEEDELYVVGRRDHERPLRGARVEGLRVADGADDALERVAELALEGERARGRGHGGPSPHEERVAEGRPEPGEGAADGGLTQPQALGGARDVALREQHVEDDEQVQIERGEVPGIHGCS